MAEKQLDIKGFDEVIGAFEKIADNISIIGKVGVKKAADNLVEYIQTIYVGRPGPGFSDRTGALRRSIKSGIFDTEIGEDVVGFVSAGDDSLGSEGKPTRTYATLVEFGEFRRAGHTSFLRAGGKAFERQIFEIIAKEFHEDKLIG